jgi:hypothetical protein
MSWYSNPSNGTLDANAQALWGALQMVFSKERLPAPSQGQTFAAWRALVFGGLLSIGSSSDASTWSVP